MRKLITKTCPQCSLDFQVPVNHKNQQFCSRRCHGLYRSERDLPGCAVKGRAAWNAEGLTAICIICDRQFPIRRCHLKQGRQCCSRFCKDEALHRKSLGYQIKQLADAGMLPSEIAAQVGKPVVYISHRLNYVRYRRGRGMSRTSVKKRFLKNQTCVVCGWDRCLDAAHIVGAADGGSMEESNLMPLCPNHHRLFDNGNLLPNEQIAIEEYINAKSRN